PPPQAVPDSAHHQGTFFDAVASGINGLFG
ncbi:hypothetical protein AVEN_95055-1, partial [Araneus ventricosus]